MASSGTIRTRILILSDTHGMKFSKDWPQLQSEFDLAIHCGDLTEESKLSEFSDTLDLLREIKAPLKLVIAGNHDLTLDPPTFKTVLGPGLALDDPAVLKEYGAIGEARQQLASDPDIRLLDEGIHTLTLPNGTTFSLYASPWTPRYGESNGSCSEAGGFAFQYDRRRGGPAAELGHVFDIPPRTDIVVTHGPPEGVLDRVGGRRAGCPDLFAAVARARPRLHCFGHIHVGWGAKLVTWRGDGGLDTDVPLHFTAIDNGRTAVIRDLKRLKEWRADEATDRMDETDNKDESKWLTDLLRSGCDVTPDDGIRLGEQTIFVNAAVEGDEDLPIQPPIVVEVELPQQAQSV
jgi:hypothetical protein